jgi:beta-glucosidase
VSPAVIDRAVRRVFAARARLGMLGGEDRFASIGSDQVDTPADRALALKAAQESIVLLKNEGGPLPLKPGVRLAVIGPNADALESLEANYHGTAVDPVTPLQGLRRQPGVAAVRYAQGSVIAEGAPATVPETALRTSADANAAVGLTGAYYDGLDFTGSPKLVRTDRVIAFDWDTVAPAPGVDPKRYAVRWTGVLIPPSAGDYQLAANVARCFDCRGHDPVRLYIDGQLAFQDDGSGRHAQATLHFANARPHALRLELIHTGEDQGVRLQWIAPAQAQLDEAAAAIQASDATVAFVGLSPDVEGEELQVLIPGFDGGDRTAIELPAPQRRLLEMAAASGKPLIVVLMSGSAVAIDDAKAQSLLAAWYPGEAGGTAIAQTLMGESDPSGRLPVTFYRSTKDLPAYADYRMVGRTYRYFEGAPLYPFGYGLSYTRFGYSAPVLSNPALVAGQGVSVTAEVRNLGARDGDAVAELYLTPPKSGGGQPLHSLIGIARVHLAPGESRAVRFEVSARDLSSVDAAGGRAVEPGVYKFWVGGGQPDKSMAGASLSISGRQPLPQ